jgi:murein DD-endopeptidase MepM/ murein hydrolase activator NlpD
MKKFIPAAIILIATLFQNPIFAQIFPAKNYPQGYFTWPVKAKIALAANFGELRPNHYHMGLDCKTDQRENMPIIAAAEGYIAKVKIEPYGFGRCIYINHPNGLTTLYAHLNDFYPVLEKYVTEQQYELKNWKVFIDIPPHLFPVSKGQFIAQSGNTGGSQGPHLHFEIRDTKTDKVLNPLLFDFPVTDNIPPDVLRLAIYDRNKSTYEQTPTLLSLIKKNGVYAPANSSIQFKSDKVSFAITSYDRYTGSTNKNGIYESILYDNNSAIVGFQLDSISYDETRTLNAHIDYKLHNNGGSYVQHLSRLPGFTEGVYKEVSGDGVIDLSDELPHEIKIIVKDANGNQSIVKFNITGTQITTAQKNNDTKNKFFPNQINVFENNSVQFYLPENFVYDYFDFKYNEIISPKGNIIYQIHNGTVPVHGRFNLKIKYPNTYYPNKLVLHRSWKNKNDYEQAIPLNPFTEKDWYKASFRAFGNFEIIEDNTPPVITPIGFYNGMNCSQQNRIVFVIKDDTEELRNFTAELDGQWLRFSNDKGKTFIYKFDDRCSKGEHVLKISVEDLAGNKTEKTYAFTR